MNCATTTIKCFVYVFNVICSIIGVTTIAVSAYTLGKLDSQHEHLTVCILGIIAGALVVMISFCGCCGALYENVCYMWTYATFMIILIVLQIAVVITFKPNLFVKYITAEIENEWAKELQQPGAMAPFERTLKCCGLHSPKDYENANLTLPAACYDEFHVNNHKYLYKKGCWEKYNDLSQKLAKGLRVVDWVLLVVEIITLFFSGILAHHFQRHSYHENFMY